jgi:hypothetical protein
MNETLNDGPRTRPTPEAPQPDPVPTPDALPLQDGAASGGGLTGETGVLTPDGGEFVPAERREMESPDHAGQAALKRHPAATDDPFAAPPALSDGEDE